MRHVESNRKPALIEGSFGMLDRMIADFDTNGLILFLGGKLSGFHGEIMDYSHYLNDSQAERYSNVCKIGETLLNGNEQIIAIAALTNDTLTERSGKKTQYDIAKTIMKAEMADLAFFVFYDNTGAFRFSVVHAERERDRMQFSTFKRYTYYVAKDRTNKTFREQVGNAVFSSIDEIVKAFSVEKLTKEFYKELFDWYQWALSDEIGVVFPNENNDKKIDEHLIRLITRLMFVWFIKQKKLVPEALFEVEQLTKILNDFDANSAYSGSYYNAILQNLFFATLNRPIHERAFATDKSFQGKDEHYGIKTLFRDANEGSYYQKPHQEIVALFRQVPFLNGGLFECLDKETDRRINYYDGFSRLPKKRAFVPNLLFFEKDKGLISILKRYNFTIEENSTQEIEVALDPELLGKVFENLLGAYNPETKETARRQSGSFYTPREIVNYMVDESLKAYLHGAGIPAVEVENLFSEKVTTKVVTKVATASLPLESILTAGTPLESISTAGTPLPPIPTAEMPLPPIPTAGTPLPPISTAGMPLPLNPDDRDAIVSMDTVDFMTFFNPCNEIEIHSGDLPHWRQQDVWYFITFRLADSIPLHVVEKIKEEREIWLKQHDINNLTATEKSEYYTLFAKRTEDWLNAGYGSCVLGDPKIAQIVENTLLHFNNQRYILDEYIIMPNHVHLLVKPLNNYLLPQILHSWKSFTASEINKALCKKGQLWMKESYDHIVRNQKAFFAIRDYIKNNPINVATTSPPKVATASLPLNESVESNNPTAGMPLPLLLKQIKILDPACGSGAFPMGVLNRIIEILKRLDPNINLYKTKLDLIENCIYGIDIQTIAIQISKLRFFISLIVEQTPNDNPDINYGILPLPNLESKFICANTLISLDEDKKGQLDLQDATLQEMKNQLWEIRNHQNLRASSWQEKVRLRQEDKRLCEKIEKYLIDNTVKPDEELIAKYKNEIKQLEAEIAGLPEIWVDDYQRQMSLFHEQPKSLFKVDLNKVRRDEKTKKIERLNAGIAKEEKKGQLAGLEAEIKKMTSWNLYDQNASSPFFDAKWMFGVSDGFDIVIGNPPYFSLSTDSEKSDVNGNKIKHNKLFESCGYKTFVRTGDIYCLFYERGYQLLKPQGRLCFITSNKWMRAGYGENTRKFFAENTNPEQLIDFAGVKVFESATVDTNILMSVSGGKSLAFRRRL